MSALSIEKYGAIDIGSNAMRLLIMSVVEQQDKDPIFKKVSLVRAPVRLGADVFFEGKITQNNVSRMKKAMVAFKELIDVHQIRHFRACATSAMREAENGPAVVNEIKEQIGIQIEIIEGKDEANILAHTNLKDLLEQDRSFLYVDVGGGSTELTFFNNGKRIASKSLNLGTVRLLHEEIDHQDWVEMERWIKDTTRGYSRIALIGSGGNINTIFKKSGKKLGKPLSYLYLFQYYKFIKSLSFEERITVLDMNPDRADVVVPATKIYLSAMKWGKAKTVYVPKIGLSDGIIRALYAEKSQKFS